MDQDLRLRISGWRFESSRSHFVKGRDLGSSWFPSPTSGVRFLDDPQARQADHLVVMSVSYAERAGFDPLACYDDYEVWLNLVRARGSGPRDWWFESTHLDNGEQLTWG